MDLDLGEQEKETGMSRGTALKDGKKAYTQDRAVLKGSNKQKKTLLAKITPNGAIF